MSRRIRCCLILSLCLLAAPDARSATLGRGTVELGLAGGFDRSEIEDYAITSLDLQTRLAWSVSSRVALGGSLNFSHASEDSGADLTNFGLTADCYLNFPTEGNVIPFIQLSMGVNRWSGDIYRDPEPGWILPFIGAGFRVLMGDYASVNVRAGYRYQKNAFGLEDVNSHDILLGFGLSVYPGGIQP